MYPHAHHRHSAHARRPNHRRSNVGNGDQSVLHPYAGSCDFGHEENIVVLPTLQDDGPHSIQQPSPQPTSNGSFIDPVLLEGDRLRAWLQQGGMEQEQFWAQGDLACAFDHNVSEYQMNTHGAPGDLQTHRGYPFEPSGASMSTMNDQSGNWSTPSATFSGPMGGVAMALPNVDPGQPPWSTYRTPDVYGSSYLPAEEPDSNRQDTSERTLSTTDNEGSGSFRTGESYTPLSSTGYFGNGLMDSGITERPVTGYSPSTNLGQIPPYSPFSFSVPQIDINNSNEMVPMEPPTTVEDSSRWVGNLAVPMSRTHSTRSSVSNASSAGGPPPTHTPEIMYCEVINCQQSFTGMYRRGNLGRHRRLIHGTGKPYLCEDNTCGKDFRRQDARLKHYRKYHPELAVDSPLVRRSSASRPTRRNQDVEFSNMSGWAT